jgi:uncharacterized protein (DUF433 family)
LFDHLEAGIIIDSFLDDFPTVGNEQAMALLEFANKLINEKNILFGVRGYHKISVYLNK